MPTLRDGDDVIWESEAILQYLALKKSAGGLFPVDARARLAVTQWQFWNLAHWDPACAIFAFEYVAKRFVRGADVAPDMAAIAKGTEVFHRVASVLESQLEGKSFLLGDTLTLADFSLGAAMILAESCASAARAVWRHRALARHTRRAARLAANAGPGAGDDGKGGVSGRESARLPLATSGGDVHHPADAELIGDHAEARREERLGERHLHLTAIGKRIEEAIGLGLALRREREGKALEARLSLATTIRCHQGRVAHPEARMHHLVLGSRRCGRRLLGCILEAHEHADLGAERTTIEIERFLAAAVKEQIGLDLHGPLPLPDVDERRHVSGIP
jgi:glutathione S-transferase